MKHINAKFNMTSVWSVIRTFLPERSYSLSVCFREWKTFFDRLSRCRGLPNALKVVKAISTSGKHVVMRYGFRRSHHRDRHHPSSSTRSFAGMDLRVYADGFPRCLPNIHRLLVSRRRILHLCGLSILQAYLFIRCAPTISFEDMLNPFKGKNSLGMPGFVKFVSWFAPRWIKSLNETVQSVKDDRPLFGGFKAGAYGSPSIAYAVDDAYTLLKPQYSKYLLAYCRIEAFFQGCVINDIEAKLRIQSGSDLRYMNGDAEERLPHGFRNYVKQRASQAVKLARTVFLSDRGGKTRVITSCNFFIQNCLSYIHSITMNVLKSIPTDYTYRQDEAANVILKWQREGRMIYSYDLTAATDRFPLAIQKMVLETLIPEVADSWAVLMGLPIEYQKVERSFTVGQPMGLLSSWSVFSLTHHLIVRYCAYCEGFDPFKFKLYCLLGDDIVIADMHVAKRYKSFMVTWLGIDISRQKSYVPRYRTKPCSEFAKRVFVGGKEVTPLSPDMLVVARGENPLVLIDIIHRLILRWKLKHISQDRFIQMLFERVLTSDRLRRAVTQYMFHPYRLHPLLYRIKGVREHVLRVYPNVKRFSVVKQDMVDDHLRFYSSAMLNMRVKTLGDRIDELRSSIESKLIELQSHLYLICEEEAEPFSTPPIRAAYNKLAEFVANLPVIEVLQALDRKVDYSNFTSLDSTYVHLVWADSYLSGDSIPQMGVWHAKHKFDLEFEFGIYDDIIKTNKKMVSDYRTSSLRQLFPSCPGETFNKP